MNLFIDAHIEWIKKLLGSKVDFIIVGGYSVIYHGYKRTTGDVDIWLKPDNGNKNKLITALLELDIEEDDVQQIAAMDFTKHLVFSTGEEPEKIDFLTYINQVNYEEADRLKIMADIDGMAIPFIHLNHLVLSKINTGRAKDKADIDMLQQVKNAKKP